jgi:hypothetical protein
MGCPHHEDYMSIVVLGLTHNLVGLQPIVVQDVRYVFSGRECASLTWDFRLERDSQEQEFQLVAYIHTEYLFLFSQSSFDL